MQRPAASLCMVVEQPCLTTNKGFGDLRLPGKYQGLNWQLSHPQ